MKQRCSVLIISAMIYVSKVFQGTGRFNPKIEVVANFF